MATRDINDPEFWDGRNLDSLGEPASMSDFGPGPNESLEYAREHSRIFSQALQQPIVQLPYSTPPVYQPPVYQPPAAPYQPPVSDGVSERMDRIEAALARIADRLQ